MFTAAYSNLCSFTIILHTNGTFLTCDQKKRSVEASQFIGHREILFDNILLNSNKENKKISFSFLQFFTVSDKHLFPKGTKNLDIFIFKLNVVAYNTFILSNVIGFFLITWLIYKYEKQARKMQSEDSSFSNLPQKR